MKNPIRRRISRRHSARGNCGGFLAKTTETSSRPVVWPLPALALRCGGEEDIPRGRQSVVKTCRQGGTKLFTKIDLKTACAWQRAAGHECRVEDTVPLQVRPLALYEYGIMPLGLIKIQGPRHLPVHDEQHLPRPYRYGPSGLP